MQTTAITGYRKALPQRVNVRIEKEGDGFWAKITTADGRLSNCYTQAHDIAELVVMINDAVQTHFDIPEHMREHVGFYVPLADEHIRWEAVFHELVAMQHQSGTETTLTLHQAELAR